MRRRQSLCLSARITSLRRKHWRPKSLQKVQAEVQTGDMQILPSFPWAYICDSSCKRTCSDEPAAALVKRRLASRRIGPGNIKSTVNVKLYCRSSRRIFIYQIQLVVQRIIWDIYENKECMAAWVKSSYEKRPWGLEKEEHPAPVWQTMLQSRRWSLKP